jgi:flagellar motor switch protein FliG
MAAKTVELRERPRRLQGPERVAALLLAMGKPLAERLLPHFEPSELREISRSAVALGSVPAAELEALIEEFASQFAAGLNLLVSAREIEDLLTGVMPPEQPAAAPAEPAAGTLDPAAVWDRVSQLSEAALAKYLADQHPQTAALVLSKLEPTKSAKIMTGFPPKVRDEAMRRMLASRPATEAALRIVAGALQDDLLATAAKGSGADPHERLAKIINNMDRDDMEGVLQSLGDARPKSAEILKGLLFTFEDIVALTPKARTTLLDKVPTDRLVLALKGTEAEFRETVLSGLASRARRVVESELGRNEPAAQREVTNARREIANMALDLAGRGEIQLKPEAEEQGEEMIA